MTVLILPLCSKLQPTGVADEPHPACVYCPLYCLSGTSTTTRAWCHCWRCCAAAARSCLWPQTPWWVLAWRLAWRLGIAAADMGADNSCGRELFDCSHAALQLQWDYTNVVMNWVLSQRKGAERNDDWLKYFDAVRRLLCMLCSCCGRAVVQLCVLGLCVPTAAAAAAARQQQVLATSVWQSPAPSCPPPNPACLPPPGGSGLQQASLLHRALQPV